MERWGKFVYYTVLALCGKEPESSFFGAKSARYTQEDVRKFGDKFN